MEQKKNSLFCLLKTEKQCKSFLLKKYILAFKREQKIGKKGEKTHSFLCFFRNNKITRLNTITCTYVCLAFFCAHFHKALLSLLFLVIVIKAAYTLALFSFSLFSKRDFQIISLFASVFFLFRCCNS